ncbi:MAG: hypothetical protein KDN22_02365 [Verrucomicrobiae bacterium]|nr:hypothetical protein [Verrucomicrobiae bacterium]
MKITKAVVEDVGQVNLNWSGHANAFAVEMAYDLPNWTTVEYTDESSATIPVTELPVFFRVRTLADDITLVRENEERLAVLESIREYVATVPKSTPAEENDVVSAYLKNRAELTDVVISNQCVWAEFPDGRTLVIINNREAIPSDYLPPTELPAEVDLQEIAAPREVRADESNAIPESKKVYLLSSIQLAPPHLKHTDFRIASTLQTWFTNAGYDVRRTGAHLASLTTIKNAGVLFFNGHGGFRSPKEGSEALWVMATDTKVSQKLPLIFERMIDGYAIVRPLAHDVHYIVSKRWFEDKRFMTFSKNSLVYLSACHSNAAAGYFGGEPSHMGWTNSVWTSVAREANRYFFDRLLGANNAFPIQPRQRPFDIEPVYLSMARRKLNESVKTESGNTLVSMLHHTPNNFGLFVPTIERCVEVSEHVEQLHIEGRFDPGAASETKVTLTLGQKSVSLPVISVGQNGILCELKAGAVPSVGDVRVIQRGHRSNPVPLSEWRSGE